MEEGGDMKTSGMKNKKWVKGGDGENKNKK